MRKSLGISLVAVTAVVIAVLGAAVAKAEVITAEPAGSITKTSLGAVTFSGGAISLNCQITLRGTLASAIEDVRGEPVGALTGGSVTSCNTGSLQLLFGVAWNDVLADVARLGGAPKLLPIDMNGVRVSVTILGITCLYGGNVPTSLQAEGSPLATRLVAVLANSLAKVSGSEFCPETIQMRGTFAITAQTLALVVPCRTEDISTSAVDMARGVREETVNFTNNYRGATAFLLEVRGEALFDITAGRTCRDGIRTGASCSETVRLLGAGGSEGRVTTVWLCQARRTVNVPARSRA